MRENKFELRKMVKIFLYQYKMVYASKDKPTLSEGGGIILINEENLTLHTMIQTVRELTSKKFLPDLDSSIESRKLYDYLYGIKDCNIEIGKEEFQIQKDGRLYHLKPIHSSFFTYSGYYKHCLSMKEN